MQNPYHLILADITFFAAALASEFSWKSRKHPNLRLRVRLVDAKAEWVGPLEIISRWKPMTAHPAGTSTPLHSPSLSLQSVPLAEDLLPQQEVAAPNYCNCFSDTKRSTPRLTSFFFFSSAAAFTACTVCQVWRTFRLTCSNSVTRLPVPGYPIRPWLTGLSSLAPSNQFTPPSPCPNIHPRTRRSQEKLFNQSKKIFKQISI